MVFHHIKFSGQCNLKISEKWRTNYIEPRQNREAKTKLDLPEYSNATIHCVYHMNAPIMPLVVLTVSIHSSGAPQNEKKLLLYFSHTC